MSKRSVQLHGLGLALALCLATGCAAVRMARVKQDVARLAGNLPEPPNSMLLSEARYSTGGADTRCDGYRISRLYGTDEPIGSIVLFVREEILVQDGWSVHSAVDETGIHLRHEAGYQVGVDDVELSSELVRSPFFDHNSVPLDEPYATIYEFNVWQTDPTNLEHCFGRWP